MTAWLKENDVLPSFREDLKLYRGPNNPDGSPTYTIFDPIKAQYYKIGWQESQIFRYFRPGMTANDLTQVVSAQTTVAVDTHSILQFFSQALKLNLLRVAHSSDFYIQLAEKTKVGPLKWLIFHYLYIRIPLFNPDHFLAKTLPYVAPLASKTAFTIYFFLTLIGLSLVAGRLDEFFKTFTYFFNLEGLLAFGVTYTFIKVVHEFSHAYTAKYYRLHVPAMGIILLVLWPVLYTDVTDSWKLTNRRHRLAVSAAGIIAELILAGLATLGWAMTGPGILNSMFFLASAITWVTSLLININPAMRFDGYYLLCDLWGIDNLQSRAFAITRWKLHQWFLGMPTPAPEEDLSQKRIIGMVVYSIYTWLYRLNLYLLIAVFVYFSFTKVLGIFLFIVEIAVFIIWPIAWEISDLYKQRAFMTLNLRMITTLTLATVAVLWFFLPLPHIDSFPAITVPANEQVVYIPYNGKIDHLNYKKGDPVQSGDLLFQMSSKDLNSDIASLEVEILKIQQQILVLGLSDEDRSYIPKKQEELDKVNALLKGLLDKKQQLSITADISGKLTTWPDQDLAGQAVHEGEVIGKIVQIEGVDAIMYIPEAKMKAIAINQKVSFKVYGTFTTYAATIVSIDPAQVNTLDYPQLASINKGDIAVVEDPFHRLTLVDTYYKAKIRLESPQNLRFGQTGVVEARGQPRSIFVQMINFILNLFWQQTAF